MSAPAVSAPPAPPGAAPRTAPFARTVAVLATAALIVLSQLYGAIPLFAPLRAAFDVTSGQVAWVQTAFGAAYAAAFLAWGPLVDRVGPRRIMLLGLVALVVTTVGTSLATSFSAVLAGRVLQGVSAASFAPAAFAYLGGRIAPARRPLSLTVLTSSFLASAVLGQVAAQLVTDSWGWRWFFSLSAAAVALVAVAIRGVVLPDLPRTGAAARPARDLGRLLTRPAVLLLLPATILILAPMIALYTAVSSTGLADGGALLALRASALPAMLWAPFGHRWLSRSPAPRRLAVAFLVTAVAAGSIALAPGSVLAVGVAMFVVAGALSVAAPAMIQTLTGHAPGAQGSVTALYTCFLFLGASLAPTAVTSTGATLTATALAGAVAAALAAGLVRVAHTRPAPDTHLSDGEPTP